MGKSIHKLSNINLEDKIGDCLKCGPLTPLKVRGSKAECSVRVKERDKKYKEELKAKFPEKVQCEVCGSQENLVFDHDHSCCPGQAIDSCGKCIRGILCRNCNLAEGFLKSNEDFVLRLYLYLTKNKKPDTFNA